MKVLLSLLLLFVAAPAFAQTCTTPSPQTTPPTFTCEVGSAHNARFDYAAAQFVAGDKFRLYVNNAQVGADVPAVQGTTTVDIAFGATLPVGAYAVAVAAFRPVSVAGPAEARSAPVNMVLANPAPSAPSGLRMVEVIMRGLDVAGNELWRQTSSMAVTQ